MSCPESSGGKGLKEEEEIVSSTTYSLLHRVYSRNWPMGVKWAPFCNFRGPYFKKGGPRKGVLQKVFALGDALLPFWKILISGQMKKPGLELLQNVCQVK